MFELDNIWVYFCLLAIGFTGYRGYQRKVLAVKSHHHQHLHLISTITTALICVVAVAFTQPSVPENYTFFLILCLINGLGYALAGVCNYGAIRHLSLEIFQSASKLSAFLPVIIFYFILGESLSSLQIIGIFAAVFPIVMLAYIETGPSPDKQNKKDTRKGVSFLVLYILVTSAMQLVNVLAVKDDVNYSLGADPFLFIMCTNAISLPYMVFMIIRSREKIALPVQTLKAGVSAGVVNAIAFITFLIAISTGPASIVVPLYSYNAFVSVALSKAWPVDGKNQFDNKAIGILLFLALWGITSAALLIFEST